MEKMFSVTFLRHFTVVPKLLQHDIESTLLCGTEQNIYAIVQCVQLYLKRRAFVQLFRRVPKCGMEMC